MCARTLQLHPSSCVVIISSRWWRYRIVLQSLIKRSTIPTNAEVFCPKPLARKCRVPPCLSTAKTINNTSFGVWPHFRPHPHIVVLNYERLKPSPESYELGWVEVCHFDDNFTTALFVELIKIRRVRARVFIAIFRALFSLRLELTVSIGGDSSQYLQDLGSVMRRERSHFARWRRRECKA